MQSYIPRTLFEVDNADMEKDIEKMKNGNGSELFYQLLTGMDLVMKKRKEELYLKEEEEEDEEEDKFEEDFKESIRQNEELYSQIIMRMKLMKPYIWKEKRRTQRLHMTSNLVMKWKEKKLMKKKKIKKCSLH